MSTRIGPLLAFFLVFSGLLAQNDTVRLNLAIRSATAISEVVCLPLTAETFDGVLSAQFSLTWDTDRLTFSDLKFGANPLGLSNAQYNVAADTAVGVSWTSADGNPVSLPDHTVLLEFCFTNLAETGFSPVNFDGWLEPEFAVGPPIMLGEYVITPGGIQVEANELSSMYPGDTNADSTVNYLDLLPIGLGFGAVGPPRSNGSINFNEQQAPVWGQTLPVSGTNFRHIDADGNGQIGNADASIVNTNYGASISPLWEERPVSAARTQLPQLYVKADTVLGGQTSVLEIYLEDGSNQIEVYGMGFKIEYDPELVVAGSFDVDFAGSFFAGDGASLLTLERELSTLGEVHIALTRRNRNNYAGHGLVARLSFQPLPVAQGAIAELPMTVSGIRLLSADEFSTSVAGLTTTIGIEGTTATRAEPAWANEIVLYPNPVAADGALQVRATAGKISSVQLFSTTGRLLIQRKFSPQLDLSRLAAGTYLLRLTGPDGTVTREIVKH